MSEGPLARAMRF